MFRLCENFLDFTFSCKIYRFSFAKISDDLLFCLFQYISPLFRENFYFPPTFQNFPPTFQNVPSGLQKFTCFYILYVYFVSPYYDHDAFMHHPMHAVDASDAPYCVWVPVRLLMMPYVYDLNFGFVWSVGLRGILESVHSFSRTEA